MLDESMEIDVRKDVLVVPYTKFWEGGPEINNIPPHGRINNNSKPIDTYPQISFETKLSAKKVSGKYLYGGPMYHHFGHIMADSIIRLWAYNNDVYRGVVFSGVGTKETALPEWIKSIFSIFNINFDRLIVVHSPTIFEEMDFAKPGTSLGSHPENWYLGYLKKLPIPKESTGKKLYLGRHHTLDKGTIMGESYFSKKLANAGFIYYAPESDCIRDQAATLYGADKVVFIEGSAVYAIELLAESCAKFYMIPRRPNFHERFRKQIEKRAEFNLLGDPENVIRLENNGGIIHPSSPSYILNPELVFDDMKRYGLIENDEFSLSDYEAAEAADVCKYFSKNLSIGSAQVEIIKDKRNFILKNHH